MTPMRPRTAGTVRLSMILTAGLLMLSGCGLGTPSSAPTSSVPASLAPSSAPGSDVPASTVVEPSSTPSTGPTASDSGQPPSEPPASGSDEPSPSSSSAASVCSGAKDTPDFYAAFAGSVSFPVYCAVLPAGWSLVSGTYRLANGGHIQINFRRKSDNATFELDEGSFCADSSGCVPAGSAAGSGPFGDLTGDLVQTATGYALVVAKAEKPSWLAIGNGLDQATFLGLTGALHAVN